MCVVVPAGVAVPTVNNVHVATGVNREQQFACLGSNDLSIVTSHLLLGVCSSK